MRVLTIVLCSILLCCACKKPAQVHTFGNVVLVIGANDTIRLNTVSARKGGATEVYINATGTNNRKVDLILWNYQDGRHNYNIDYRGAGTNINGSALHYTDYYEVFWAKDGVISVTDFDDQSISGTFNVVTNNNTYRGTFIAPLPR